MVGRIKMKLGMQVGLDPGHIVLDGDPAPLPQRGTAPTQFSAHICCGQMTAWINATWYGARPQPRGLCVRRDPAPLKFSARLLWSPYVIGQTIIFLPCGKYVVTIFFYFLA